jgi:uncharacterized protein (TIGR02145 family)
VVIYYFIAMLRLFSLLFLAASLFWGCVSIGFFGEDAIETCDGEKYRTREQICENGVLKNLCGNGYYDPKMQFCLDDIVFEKCNGNSYNPVNQKCEGIIILNKCGNDYYNSEMRFCNENEVFDKCGGSEYEPTIQDCCNNAIFASTTYKCKDGILHNKCGNEIFDPFFEYCLNNVINDKEILTDNRDDKTYKYVVIGTQTWMAENLRYEAQGTECYDSNPDNCEILGTLYSFYAIRNTNICPTGWHLPSAAEWNALKYLADDAGTLLKANSELWGAGKGMDIFGFTVLPNGYWRSGFSGIGESTYFWSATYSSSYNRYYYYFNTNQLLTYQSIYEYELLAYVRCIKD